MRGWRKAMIAVGFSFGPLFMTNIGGMGTGGPGLSLMSVCLLAAAFRLLYGSVENQAAEIDQLRQSLAALQGANAES